MAGEESRFESCLIAIGSASSLIRFRRMRRRELVDYRIDISPPTMGSIIHPQPYLIFPYSVSTLNWCVNNDQRSQVFAAWQEIDDVDFLKGHTSIVRWIHNTQFMGRIKLNDFLSFTVSWVFLYWPNLMSCPELFSQIIQQLRGGD